MMLLLKCPKCRQEMKYQNKDGILTKKIKKCVYCGHSYKVGDNIKWISLVKDDGDKIK
ncbi:hypothetical protein HYU07_00555 [Candidatus Woesearchaeota archaeon]|nr:hypothetical protein [Candidatus Woesearchaeota archaeon]